MCILTSSKIRKSNGHSQELHYFPFAVKLDRYVGSCNTLNIPNKIEDLNACST